MTRFYIQFKKWAGAYSDSLSVINDQVWGEIEDIDFRFGPPRRNGFPCYISIHGIEKPLFELSDIRPSFAELREWMERATNLSSLNRLNPEMVNLQCVESVVTISLVPGSWADDSAEMISLLTVIFPESEKAIVKSFCRTYETIGRLYTALIKATLKFEKDFSNPSNWNDPERYNGLEKRSCSERIRSEFQSDLVELRTIKRGKRKI